MESFAIIPVVYFVGKIDFKDETNLLYARIAFASSFTIVSLLSLLVYSRIMQNKDKTKFKVKPEGGITNRNPEMVEMTVPEYDLTQIKRFWNQTGIGLAIVMVIHLYGGYAAPLAIQSIMLLFQLYRAPLFRIYLLGMTLPRPFPDDNPLAKLLRPEEPAPETTVSETEISDPAESVPKPNPKKNSKKAAPKPLPDDDENEGPKFEEVKDDDESQQPKPEEVDSDPKPLIHDRISSLDVSETTIPEKETKESTTEQPAKGKAKSKRTKKD